MSQWILLVGAADLRLYRWMAAVRRPRLTRFMLACTRLGDPASVVLLATLLLMTGGTVSQAAAASAVIAFVLSQVLKRLIARPRPALGVGFRSVIEAPDHFSFPSGHAAVSLALWLPWALALPGYLGIPLLAGALLVGVSRSYLGVHYPGDVFAGWVLALASAVLGAQLAG